MHTLAIDCIGIARGSIRIELKGDAAPKDPLSLEALHCKSEHFIEDLKLNGLPLEHAVEAIKIDSRPFVLEYSVVSRFSAFVGAHKQLNLTYPFFNSEEAYLGSGLLPVIHGYEQAKNSFWYDLKISNFPDDWELFTNLAPRGAKESLIPMEKAEQLFFYASRKATSFEENNTCLVLGANIVLPCSPSELFGFYRNSIDAHIRCFGPNDYAQNSLVLVLQSPPDFAELTEGQTFSTGENYTGGIALYGPNQDDVYRKLGHTSYSDFLLGGLHHEIGHAYTSAGPARFKSILYASSACPRNDRLIIGESLNGYFNGATRLSFDPNFQFSLKQFVLRLEQEIVPDKQSPTLDLLLFDLELRLEANSSLCQAYRAMLDEKRKKPGPYDSAKYLIQATERLLGLGLSQKTQNYILAPEPENYAENLREALQGQGWTLETIPEDRNSTIQFFFT